MNHLARTPASISKEAYLASANSWAREVSAGLRRSRSVAWTVASVAVATAMLEALALSMLMPLKTTTPYAFVVDRETGYIASAAPLQQGPLTQSAAVTQSNLVRYVLARETFDGADLQENYRRVVLWTRGVARARYIDAMRGTNPASPLRVYPRDAVVRTTIKSVSLLGPQTALVRFFTSRDDQPGDTQTTHYAAVVGFRYSLQERPMADRFDNPLGFEVVSYRRDLEALPVAAVER